jgi:hypothetical protein
MDEGRKKLIYLVAGMFLVRRLAGLDPRPSPARENAFRDAIDNALELNPESYLRDVLSRIADLFALESLRRKPKGPCVVDLFSLSTQLSPNAYRILGMLHFFLTPAQRYHAPFESTAVRLD